MDPKEIAAVIMAEAHKHGAPATPGPRADFVSCLLVAVFAVLPQFIVELTGCMAGGGSSTPDKHTPGDRPRC